MTIPTWSVGQVLTASDVNNWFVPLAAYKSIDQSITSSTTFTDDTVLGLTVAANASYIVDMSLIYDGDSAGDLKLQFTKPAGASHTNTFLSSLGGTAATTSDNVVSGGSTVPILGCLGAGTNCGMLWKSFLSVSSTSGTLQLQWAQNATSATATRVRAGSYLLAQRVN